jgi:urease accessory protein
VTAAIQGEARLRFAYRHDHTILEDCFFRAPFHVSGPLWREDAAVATVALQTSGGGMLSGDALHVSIHCAEGASARVGGVGATRLLSSATASRQDIRIRLEQGSALLYLPEPLIPCKDAQFVQTMEIDASASATAVVGEIVTSGRAGLGERFTYRHLSFQALVRRDGIPACRDRLLLEPDAGHIRSQFGDFSHLGTLMLIGPTSTQEMAAALHGLLEIQDILAGVTQAAAGVLLVRLLGSSAYALRALMDRVVGRYLCRVSDAGTS